MDEYPISKRWDCVLSLEEIIKDNGEIMSKDGNENCCYLVTNYRKHSSDDCFGGFIILLAKNRINTLTEKLERAYFQIGIRDDGFVYIGDQMRVDKVNSVFLPVKQALDIMVNYMNFMNSRGELEYALSRIVEESSINIIYSHNYEPELKNKKEFTIYDNDYGKYNKSRSDMSNVRFFKL